MRSLTSRQAVRHSKDLIRIRALFEFALKFGISKFYFCQHLCRFVARFAVLEAIAECGEEWKFVFDSIFADMRESIANIKFHFNHDLTVRRGDNRTNP